MMDNKILLTYSHVNGYYTYDWFNSIDEVNEFVMNSNVVHALIECVDCSLAKSIPLEELGD